MTDTLHEFLTRHRIHEVECVIPDMTGIARGKILPRDLFQAAGEMRLPKSVLLNESMWIGLEEEAAPHRKVVVRQIAGLFARRIVCALRPGEVVDRGRFIVQREIKLGRAKEHLDIGGFADAGAVDYFQLADFAGAVDKGS